MSRYAYGFGKAAVITPINPNVKLLSIANVEVTAGQKEMAKVAVYLKEHLSTYASNWSSHYNDMAIALCTISSDEAKEKSVVYSCLSRAFHMVTIDIVLFETNGYIDLSRPEETYLGTCAKNYARKRRLSMPRLRGLIFNHASELAGFLDTHFKPQVSFSLVEEECRKRLEMFCNDIKQMIEPIIPKEDEKAEENEKVPDPEPVKPPEIMPEGLSEEAWEFAKSNGYSKYSATHINLFYKMYVAESKPIITITLEKVASSYPDYSIAEAHAKFHGFASFEDAYNSRKEEARYDLETKYTQDAEEHFAKLARAENGSDDFMI